MAASACRSVSVGDTSEPWTATPALNVVDASTFVHAAAMRSAIARAVGPAPGRTTRYSSPPKRTLALYGAEGAADNLTRITVDGSSNNTDWLKVQVHRSGPEVMTWEAGPLQLTIGCTSGRHMPGHHGSDACARGTSCGHAEAVTLRSSTVEGCRLDPFSQAGSHTCDGDPVHEPSPGLRQPLVSNGSQSQT